MELEDFTKIMFVSLCVVIIIMLALFVITLFNRINTESTVEDNRMQYIEKVVDSGQVYGYILYDTKTKVMYLFNYNGGIVVMTDNEGQPLLYKEEK